MTGLSFVNIHGDAVDTNKRVAIRRPKPVADYGFHKGFRVEGHKPGALEEARLTRQGEILDAKALASKGRAVKIPADFNDEVWLNNAKKSPVRSKPYEVESAALTCKEIAEKAGWLCVVVREVKREPSNADGH